MRRICRAAEIARVRRSRRSRNAMWWNAEAAPGHTRTKRTEHVRFGESIPDERAAYALFLVRHSYSPLKRLHEGSMIMHANNLMIAKGKFLTERE